MRNNRSSTHTEPPPPYSPSHGIVPAPATTTSNSFPPPSKTINDVRVADAESSRTSGHGGIPRKRKIQIIIFFAVLIVVSAMAGAIGGIMGRRANLENAQKAAANAKQPSTSNTHSAYVFTLFLFVSLASSSILFSFCFYFWSRKFNAKRHRTVLLHLLAHH